MSKPQVMHSYVEQYLREHRRVGFQLRTASYSLRSFARHIDALGHRGPLTVEIMTHWAQHDTDPNANPGIWARRLKHLRSFTRWLQQFDPSTEVPDDIVLRRLGQRLAPHIFSEPEIVDLLGAARRLGPAPGLRGAIYEALFGLIASTGLRLSEALHLCNADVDLKSGMLTVRQTKFAKSRQVPMHPSTVEALRRYRRLRDLTVAANGDTPFFVATRGRRCGQPLGQRQVHRVFAALREQLGWRNRGAHHAPRCHDLRHSFVVNRVLRWHAQGTDIDQAMLSLSTYVGHAKVTNTYWYLSAVPDLMVLAAAKFEALQPQQEESNA